MGQDNLDINEAMGPETVVPQSWKFPERSYSGLNITELEEIKPDNKGKINHLALEWPSPEPSKGSYPPGHNPRYSPEDLYAASEYIFDGQGDPTSFKKTARTGINADVRLMGDIPIDLNIKKGNTEFKDMAIFFLRGWPKEPGEFDKQPNELAYALYAGNNLHVVSFNRFFNLPKSAEEPGIKWGGTPSLEVQIRNDVIYKKGINAQAYNTADFYCTEVGHQYGDGKHTLEPVDEKNPLPSEYYMVEGGKPQFIFRWHVEKGILVVEQEYLQGDSDVKGLIKQVRAPIVVDKAKIDEMVYSKVSRDPNTGELKIPWVDAVHESGVSLGYKYPEEDDSTSLDRPIDLSAEEVDISKFER